MASKKGMEKTPPPTENKKVSIIFVTFDDLRNFETCFSSLKRQTYRNFEVIISDNNSTDGSLEFLRTRFPEYRVLNNGKNLGYGGGNNAGFRHGTGDYFLVLNNDVEMEETFLAELMSGLENDPEAKIATPKILLYGARHRINCLGNRIHFTGMTFCNRLNELSVKYMDNVYPNNFSGACFLISRDWLKELNGGFDEDYVSLFTSDFWTSLEDVDLAFKTHFRGYEILCVASSIIYHKYDVKFSPKKLFFLECGRYLLVAKNYPLQLILVFLPGFILMEIVVLGYALLQNKDYLLSKVKTYGWLIKNRRRLSKKRKLNQDLRHEGVKAFFRTLSYEISIGELVEKNVFLKVLEKVVNAVFRVFFLFGCVFIMSNQRTTDQLRNDVKFHEQEKT